MEPLKPLKPLKLLKVFNKDFNWFSTGILAIIANCSSNVSIPNNIFFSSLANWKRDSSSDYNRSLDKTTSAIILVTCIGKLWLNCLRSYPVNRLKRLLIFINFLGRIMDSSVNPPGRFIISAVIFIFAVSKLNSHTSCKL